MYTHHITRIHELPTHAEMKLHSSGESQLFPWYTSKAYYAVSKNG